MMAYYRFLFMVSIFLLCSCIAYADNLTIYEDATIWPGDQYDNVYVLNELHQVNSCHVLGGTVENLMVYNTNVLTISGGTIHSVFGYDSSRISLESGSITNYFAHHQSETVISDSLLETVSAYGSSNIILSGGIVSDWLFATELSVVQFDCTDFYITETGGLWGFGYVQGVWHDQTPFQFNLYDAETINHIIPEPCSPALFALAGLALRKGAVSILRKK